MATKNIILGRWNAPGMRLPAGESARLETISVSGGDRQAVTFNDSADETCILTDAEWPDNFRGDGTLKIDLFGVMSSATTGTLRFNVEVEAITPGDSLDLDSALSFDTANAATSASVPATPGHLFKTTITLTNADSVAVGDYVRLRITRDADHIDDTAAGDFRLLGAHVYEEVTYFRVAGMEFLDDDSDYVRLKAPANVTTAYTLTWPTAAPASNGYGVIVSTAGTMTFEAITATPAGSAQGQVQRRNNAGTGLEADDRLSFASGILTIKGSASAIGIDFDAGSTAWLKSSGDNTFQIRTDGVEIADAKDVVLNTTTGTKFGTSATQKLALWGATPIAQPSGANQAALTDSTGGTADGTVSEVTDLSTGDTYTDAAVNGKFDIVNDNFKEVLTLQLAMRTALVDAGLMKGSS